MYLSTFIRLRDGRQPPHPLHRVLFQCGWILAIAAFSASSAHAQVVPYLQWNFNDSTTSTSINATGGNPTLTTIGLTNVPAFATDNQGFSGDVPPAGDNVVWSTTGYPGLANASGTAGIQISGINTVSRPDTLLSFSLGTNNGSSAWYQLQYRAVTAQNPNPVFQNYCVPFQSIRTDNHPWAVGGTFSLAGLSAIENQSNVQFRLVSVFQPGTTSYQGVVSGYNPAAAVQFDLITLAQANRLLPTVGSTVDLQTASNWTLGQIPEGTAESNLVFGPNTNAAVTAINVNNATGFNARSIVFREDATKPYTLTGTAIRLGEAANVNRLVGTPTLVNASGQTQTFQSGVEYVNSQTWDAGSKPGGKLVFNDKILYTGSSPTANLTILGTNRVEANQGVWAFSAPTTITRTGGALVVGDPGFTLSAVNMVANSGGKIIATGDPVNGSVTSGGIVTLNSGGQLAGIGRVASTAPAAVTVNAGGMIRGGIAVSDSGTPTQAVGALTVNGNVLVKGGSGMTGGSLGVDLNGTTNTNSRINITDVNSAGVGKLNVDLTGNTAFKVKLLNDSALQLNQAYSFIVVNAVGGFQKNGASVAAYSYGSDFQLESETFGSFGTVSLTDIGSGNLRLSFTPLTPVPELPAQLGAATAALMAGMWWRRRGSGHGAVPAVAV